MKFSKTVVKGATIYEVKIDKIKVPNIQRITMNKNLLIQ